MHVAVVTGHVRELVEGRAGARTTHTVAGLRAAGHEVSLVTPRWWGQSTRRHHGRWGTHHAGGGRRLTARHVSRRILGLNPAVVHLVGVRPSVALAATGAARLRRGGVVYELAEMDGPLTDGGWLAERAGARVDRFIAPTEAVRTALLEAGIDPQLDVLADPIEMGALDRVVPDTRTDLVWVGSQHGARDVERVLLALAEVRDRPWSAALLGPFEHLDAVSTEVGQLGLSDRVRVARHPTVRERVATYRGASTFVQTTPVCAFPTELLWALASGCSGVVQYRERSGAHELIEAHGRGTLVSTDEELAAAIADGLDGENRGLDETFARYDRSAYVERLLGCYEAALT